MQLGPCSRQCLALLRLSPPGTPTKLSRSCYSPRQGVPQLNSSPGFPGVSHCRLRFLLVTNIWHCSIEADISIDIKTMILISCLFTRRLSITPFPAERLLKHLDDTIVDRISVQLSTSSATSLSVSSRIERTINPMRCLPTWFPFHRTKLELFYGCWLLRIRYKLFLPGDTTPNSAMVVRWRPPSWHACRQTSSPLL